jgi:excisionase family DNA binding protein
MSAAGGQAAFLCLALDSDVGVGMARVVALGDGWWKTDRAAVKEGKKAAEPKPVRRSIRDTELWKVSKVAQKLDVSRETILRYIRDGKLYAEAFGGEYRVPVWAVDEFLDRERNKRVG